MRKRVFVDELFHRSNGDWVRACVEDAGAFAQPVLRANAAANFRHVACRTRQCRRFEKTTVGSECEPFWNSVSEWTTLFDAGRVRAIDAATRLRARGGFIEQTVDLIKVADAFADSPFWRRLTRDVAPVVLCWPTRNCCLHRTHDRTSEDSAYASLGKRCAFIGRPSARKLSFPVRRLASRRSGRDSRTSAARRSTRHAEASPPFKWHCRNGHQRELANHESDQPGESLLHEAVGMQADTEHVHAEPGKTGDDVAEDAP